jgi:hypothetical protein
MQILSDVVLCMVFETRQYVMVLAVGWYSHASDGDEVR